MAIEADTGASEGEAGGVDIQAVNVSVGAAIGDIVRTTLGPTGMDKMLVDSNGMVLITNNAKTLLGEMNINLDLLPAAKLLKEVAMGQNEAVGDGTTTAVVVAGELLRSAEELFERGLHPTSVARGYRLAARRAEAEIAKVGRDVPLDGGQRLEEIVRTAISGTGGAQDEDRLASLIVEAADDLAATGPLRWDRLRVKKVSGGTVADSSFTRGVVVEGAPVHAGMPRLIEPADIVCFNTDLTVEEMTADPGALGIEDPDDVDWLLDHEARDIASKVDAIVQSGANVVFSDESIDERAQQRLADHGILALRRMASSDLERVARATGASITDPSIVKPADLGTATRVEFQRLGNDQVLRIATENPRRGSLVLRGGTEQVLNEMERAARSGFAAVRALYEDGRTVPGGGAIEVRTALALREYASGVDAREQLAIEAFADALETIPRSLAENAGCDPIDTLLELRHRHAAGDTTAGVHALERRIDDVALAGIVDPVVTKQQSVATAADVVSRIVRIDGVLEAERKTEIEEQ